MEEQYAIWGADIDFAEFVKKIKDGSRSADGSDCTAVCYIRDNSSDNLIPVSVEASYHGRHCIVSSTNKSRTYNVYLELVGRAKQWNVNDKFRWCISWHENRNCVSVCAFIKTN